jgi:hypothetical protein
MSARRLVVAEGLHQHVLVGSSTPRAHSNHRHPGSDLVASVKSLMISGQRSASSALTRNFAVMKIMPSPQWTGRQTEWTGPTVANERKSTHAPFPQLSL